MICRRSFILATFAVSSTAVASDMVYQCIDATGASRYTDQLCGQGDQCKKWGPHGWSAEQCAEDIKQRNSPPPAPQQVPMSPLLPRDQLSAKTDPPADSCSRDLRCWGDKNQFIATRRCRVAVENRAKYQFRWDDSWLEEKFPRFRWGNRERGTVIYVGDLISMQNGFGAWQRMRYACEFDPKLEAAIDVEVSPRN